MQNVQKTSSLSHVNLTYIYEDKGILTIAEMEQLVLSLYKDIFMQIFIYCSFVTKFCTKAYACGISADISSSQLYSFFTVVNLLVLVVQDLIYI